MNEVDNSVRGDAHGAVGSYVVHALDEPELSEFEAHLADCDQCSNEITSFNETLAEMTAVFDTAPPPALRTSVLNAISGISQLPAERDQTGPAAPRHGFPVVPEDEAPEKRAGKQSLAPVTSLGEARPRRAPRALIAIAAAVAVIAVAAGGWAVSLNQKLQNQQAGQAMAQQAQRESNLLRAPDAKIYTAKLQDGSPVSYVVSKTQNAAALIGGNVASPGAGKVYQLWTISGKSNTTFARDATFGGGNQQSVFLTTDVGRANLLGISIEPTGSTPSKPTTTPFAVATL